MAQNLSIHWNILNLPAPPQTTVILRKPKDANIETFFRALNSIESILLKIKFSHSGALISRLIYKIKLKFRSNKWLKLLEKINVTLLKILNSKLSQALLKIKEITSPKEKRIPSRALFEWFLLKLQGFSRVLLRLVVLSYQCAVLCRQHLTVGHNWHSTVVVLSVVSQLWVNSQLVLQHTMNSYAVVHKIMKDTIYEQKTWSNEPLPNDLSTWIQEEFASLGCENDILKLKFAKPNKETDELVLPSQIVQEHGEKKDIEDLGETVSRDELLSNDTLQNITIIRPQSKLVTELISEKSFVNDVMKTFTNTISESASKSKIRKATKKKKNKPPKSQLNECKKFGSKGIEENINDQSYEIKSKQNHKKQIKSNDHKTKFCVDDGISVSTDSVANQQINKKQRLVKKKIKLLENKNFNELNIKELKNVRLKIKELNKMASVDLRGELRNIKKLIETKEKMNEKLVQNTSKFSAEKRSFENEINVKKKKAAKSRSIKVVEPKSRKRLKVNPNDWSVVELDNSATQYEKINVNSIQAKKQKKKLKS